MTGRSDHIVELQGEIAALKTRVALLEVALQPLAKIADEYDADGLDECRPQWVVQGNEKFDLKKDLYCGRGGLTLITLEDVMRARQALTGDPYSTPAIDARMARAEKHFTELNIGSASWEELPQSRRDEYAARLDKLLGEIK